MSESRAISRLVAVAFFTFTLVPTTRAQEPPSGPFIGRHTGAPDITLPPANNAAEAIQIQARELAEARRQFWAAYPNGANLATARQRFSFRLFQKDYHFLVLAANYRAEQPSAGGLTVLDLVFSGPSLDGGISILAERAFSDLVDVVFAKSTRLGPGVVVAPHTLDIPEAAAAYADYIAIRDLNELLISTHSPLLSRDAAVQAAASMIIALRLTSMDEGRRQYEALLATLGTETTREIVTTLATQMEPRRWYLTNPAAAGVSTSNPREYIADVARRATTAGSDDQRFLTAVMAGIGMPDQDWVKARSNYDRLTRDFGEQRVLAFARRLRTEQPQWQCPLERVPTCLHDVFQLPAGEMSYFEALERGRIVAERSQAIRDSMRVADSIRLSDPEYVLKRGRRYWDFNSQHIPAGRAREVYIFQGQWKALARSGIPDTVRAILTGMDRELDEMLPLQQASSGHAPDPAASARLQVVTNSLNSRVEALRSACATARGDVCEIYQAAVTVQRTAIRF
jgi:hypothetical protein